MTVREAQPDLVCSPTVSPFAEERLIPVQPQSSHHVLFEYIDFQIQKLYLCPALELRWLSKESACKAGDLETRKVCLVEVLRVRAWQFHSSLPVNPMDRRCRGYSSYNSKKSDMTEVISRSIVRGMHFCIGSAGYSFGIFVDC